MAAYNAGSGGAPPTQQTTGGGTTYTQTTQQTETSDGAAGGSSYAQTNSQLNQLFEARKNKLPIVNPLVNAINQITERAIKNQIAKANEFYYENGKPVKAGTTYHIHYTTDLGEYFMSGGVHNSTSKLMFPLKYDVSQFTYYNTLNEQSPLKLSSQVVSPKEEDYKKGSYKRYFAKQANDKNQPTFEVSKQNFQSSPLYNYVSLRWYITGNKNYVYSQNTKQIRIASARIATIKKLLTPFQFYRFEENLSIADRLANMMDLSNYNTTTQSNINVSSTEGLGDGSGDGGGLVSDSSSYTTDADGNIEDEEKMC